MSVTANGSSLPERLVFAALAGAVSLALISIFASQVLLFAAIAGSVWLWWIGKRPVIRFPPVFWPLIMFAAWSIIAGLSSHDIARALTETKKFFLYLIIFLVPFVVQNCGKLLLKIYTSIFLVSVVAASAGLVQFLMNPRLDLEHRISGLMSHWMTYSEQLMLVLVALTAYAICRNGRARWWVFVLGATLAAGMYLSQTRNAWLGSIAGIVTVLSLKRPRAIFAMTALVLLLYLVSPATIKQRLRSSWDSGDPETRGRIELVQTSLRLIKDNPWLGVGPRNVYREALRYRGSHEFEDWLYQHMHNNFLQIAAERGIPGLMLWLWLMIRLAWDALKVWRSATTRGPADFGQGATQAVMVSTAALGGWVAFLVSGMLQYNFGDSEVLTLYLFMATAPYVFLQNLASNRAEGSG